MGKNKAVEHLQFISIALLKSLVGTLLNTSSLLSKFFLNLVHIVVPILVLVSVVVAVALAFAFALALAVFIFVPILSLVPVSPGRCIVLISSSLYSFVLHLGCNCFKFLRILLCGSDLLRPSTRPD